MKENVVAETEAYLAKIRKTVAASRELVATAQLRLDETDRLLAREGLTREDVLNFKYTPEQEALVEAKLEEMGMSLPKVEARDASLTVGEAVAEGPVWASEASANFTAGDGDGAVENRKRKFNVMMQQFRM